MSALLAEHPEGLREVHEDRTLAPADVRLYETLLRHGKALCADQVWAMRLVPGGRDAIRASMRRLKQGGHVVVRKRMYSPGHWRNEQVFGYQVEAPKWGLRLVPDLEQGALTDTPGGCSGVQVLGGLGVQRQSQDQEIKIEEEKSTLLLSTRGSSSTPKNRQIGHTPAGRMHTPVPGAVRSSSTTPRVTRRTRSTDSDPVPPKGLPMLRDQDRDDIDFANPMATTPVRTARPERTPSAPRGTSNRHSKPTTRWTCFDLTAEFNVQACRVSGDAPHQTNTSNLSGALGRMIREGSDPAVLAQCLELFFDKPSNLRDMGEGFPLWRRFLADVTRTYGKARKVINRDTITDNEHYAQDVAWAEEQRAQMPAIEAESDRIAEEQAAATARAAENHRKTVQQRQEAAQDALTAPVSWMLLRAAQEAEKAAQHAAQHALLQAESEARLAEHPEEEWFEEEEEWLEDDATTAVVSA